MKNNIRVFLLLFMIIFISNQDLNAASNDVYFRADFGIPYYNKLSKDYYKSRLHRGQFFNVGLGYKFENKIRADITLSRLNNAKFSYNYSSKRKNYSSYSHFNVNSTVAMANIYYDLLNKDHFNIYIGSGVGASHNSVSSNLMDIKSTGSTAANPVFKRYNQSNKNYSFAYAVTIGTFFKITKSSSIDFGYKYYDLGKIKHKKDPGVRSSRSKKSPLRVHTINIGLRFFL